MSYASILRNGIALLDTLLLTNKMEALVTYQAWLKADGYGTPVYDDPIELRAFVDQTVKIRRAADGQLVQTKASVMFLQPLHPHTGTAERTEPVDTRDIITLPDGTTGPTIQGGGVIDGETGAPYFSEILIGMSANASSSV